MAAKESQLETATIEDLYDITAEESVLSILLYEPGLLPSVSFSASDFTNWQRQDIWQAIASGGDFTAIQEKLSANVDAYLLAIDLFMDVGNGEVSTDDLQLHALRVAKASKLRLSGAGATCLAKPSANEIAEDPLPQWAKEKPKQITSTRQLVDNFWQNKDPKPVMVAPFVSQLPLVQILTENNEPGAGTWPKAPKKAKHRTAIIGTVITVTPSEKGYKGKLTDRHDRKWRQCKREYYFRVKRETRKALAHIEDKQILHYQSGLDIVDVDKQVSTWRKRKQRQDIDIAYQVYPLPMGEYVIVSNQDDNSAGTIPEDRTAAFELFFQWLDTPEGETLKRHSQGYGLRFEGFSGDGRLKFAKRQLIKNGQKALAAQLEENVKKIRRNVQLITEMNRQDIAQELVKTGYQVDNSRFEFKNLGKFAADMKRIDSNLTTRSGNSAYFEMSRLTHTEKNKDSVSSSRDNGAAFVPLEGEKASAAASLAP